MCVRRRCEGQRRGMQRNTLSASGKLARPDLSGRLIALCHGARLPTTRRAQACASHAEHATSTLCRVGAGAGRRSAPGGWRGGRQALHKHSCATMARRQAGRHARHMRSHSVPSGGWRGGRQARHIKQFLRIFSHHCKQISNICYTRNLYKALFPAPSPKAQCHKAGNKDNKDMS